MFTCGSIVVRAMQQLSDATKEDFIGVWYKELGYSGMVVWQLLKE